MAKYLIDPEYVKRRVAESCAAQGLDVIPSPAVCDVIAALIANAPRRVRWEASHAEKTAS